MLAFLLLHVCLIPWSLFNSWPKLMPDVHPGRIFFFLRRKTLNKLLRSLLHVQIYIHDTVVFYKHCSLPHPSYIWLYSSMIWPSSFLFFPHLLRKAQGVAWLNKYIGNTKVFNPGIRDFKLSTVNISLFIWDPLCVTPVMAVFVCLFWPVSNQYTELS